MPFHIFKNYLSQLLSVTFSRFLFSTNREHVSLSWGVLQLQFGMVYPEIYAEANSSVDINGSI